MKPQRFSAQPGEWAIVKLAADAPVPVWALSCSGFSSVTRTAGELSIVAPAVEVPLDIPAERGWSLLQLNGPFAFDQTGIDQAEFLISANPGEPLKPMARVASGGETARLMLALKTALAQVDRTPTLIFDEIDQGIGGRVGDVVGRKLWGLAGEANHQVVVVTHLPQLAGYGDAHFHVSKGVEEGRTTTHIDDLDLQGRVRELAAMLGTQGDTAISGAESILRHVDQAKNGLPVEEY